MDVPPEHEDTGARAAIHDLVARAGALLVRTDIPADEARLDAELLARHLLGWDRTTFFLRRREPAPEAFEPGYTALVRRRAGREPVSLLTGRREFWGREFEVDRDVLTPRPESELIVEEALDVIPPAVGSTVADVGTGSGCLAVTLALERPAVTLVAVDISSAALGVARRNASRHGVADRIRFRECHLLDGLESRVSVIVANLPYIPASQAETLPPEVRQHEPAAALFGAEADGLGLVRQVANRAVEWLEPGGWLILEFGAGQEPAVRSLIAQAGALSLARIRRDLQGIPRTAVARYLP